MVSGLEKVSRDLSDGQEPVSTARMRPWLLISA
jgi:hypothetical protein